MRFGRQSVNQQQQPVADDDAAATDDLGQTADVGAKRFMRFGREFMRFGR